VDKKAKLQGLDLVATFVSNPYVPRGRQKPWGPWATLGFSLAIVFLFVVVQTLVSIICLLVQAVATPGQDLETLLLGIESNGLVLAVATLISAPVCTALIVGLAKMRRSLSVKAYLGLHRPTPQQLALWSMITVVVMFTVDFVKSQINREIIPTFTTDIYKTAHFLPLLYIAVVVMAPVFEEIFFRGFMFKGLLASRLGVVGAILIPAILWSSIHLQYDIYDITGLFIFGLLLGVAQWRTGSIYVAIVMHALNNLIAMVQVGYTLSS